MSRNKKIILAATLLALLVLLSRLLSIKTPLLKISFAFVPTMLCATYLGWKWTVLINVLGDLIGAFVFPVGPYFIGYTLTTAIAGLIYGLLLYQGGARNKNEHNLIVRTTIATVMVALIVNMGLNTLCLSITSGKAFMVLLGTRIIKQVVMIPIHIIVFLLIERSLRSAIQQYLYAE